MLTFGITRAIDSGQPEPLSEGQCQTSVSGRYLLVDRFFGGGLAVTDMGTGESMLGPLVLAVWLD